MGRSEESMRKDYGSDPWSHPLPIPLIVTYSSDADATTNTAWGVLYGIDKVIPSSGNRTAMTIKKKDAFTISFAGIGHMANADHTSLVSAGQRICRMDESGFHEERSMHIDAQIIPELPAALEYTCENETDNGDMNIITKIANADIDENMPLQIADGIFRSFIRWQLVLQPMSA